MKNIDQNYTQLSESVNIKPFVKEQHQIKEAIQEQRDRKIFFSRGCCWDFVHDSGKGRFMEVFSFVVSWFKMMLSESIIIKFRINKYNSLKLNKKYNSIIKV